MINLAELLKKIDLFAKIKYAQNTRISEINKVVSDAIHNLHVIEKEIDRKNNETNKLLELINDERVQIDEIVTNNKSTFPWLAKAFADVAYYTDMQTAKLLKTKKNPAIKTADELKRISTEKRELVKRLKEAEYRIAYYEGLFPDLVDLTEEDSEISEVTNDVDEVLDFISTSEYKQLSETQRNQLALDRYLQRRHSKKHIGKMYERYIGYLYEQQGYKVEYFGIKKQLNDLGRDLICIKNDDVLVVQCKYWSQSKTIHENIICQLFGTAIKYKLDNKVTLTNEVFEVNTNPVFVSNINLSDTAKEFANALGVKIYKNELDKTYPMIKCNINNGNKIYHLPFDQKYDDTFINLKGECYVRTVQKAELLGFRRAKRWISSNI